MNDRVPESTGLPLRAMVMVLIFLGVIFALVCFQALGAGGDTGDTPIPGALTSATTTAAPTPEAPARPSVTVLNLSQTDGLAEDTAVRLREDGWTVERVDNAPELPGVTATTVYFTDAPGEQEAAAQVSEFLLTIPPEPRTEALAAEPPGLVVVVTG